jgi:hypothetical protein
MRLPLPRFASHPAVFVGLAGLHLYLGGGHLWQLVQGDLAWTHIWKGGGAMAGCYWFLALATARRAAV